MSNTDTVKKGDNKPLIQNAENQNAENQNGKLIEINAPAVLNVLQNMVL